MKYVAAAALAAAFVAAPASAFDGVTYRIEVQGGYDRVEVGGGKDDGQLYGIALGIDVPLGSTAFIGFEGTGNMGNLKDCATGVFALNDRYCIKAREDLGAVARVGSDLGGNLKVYALAGYANARVRETYTSGPIALKDSFRLDGVRVGLGAELKIGKSAYTKLEYRYTNYEDGFSRQQMIAGLGIGL